ncbi:hypothetical protein R1flu_011422 [Riccia fluitans]|uniref:CobQ/CobB/MinD/ParA nucleotide binding domain-containing protein n=1 Tax=Riccia fluitans TaxID=41844 RepID=A0ABD1Z8M7_9MARC
MWSIASPTCPNLVSGGTTSRHTSPLPSSSSVEVVALCRSFSRCCGGQSGNSGWGKDPRWQRDFSAGTTSSGLAAQLEQGRLCGEVGEGLFGRTGHSGLKQQQQRLGNFGHRERRGRWLRRSGHERTSSGSSSRLFFSPQAILQWNRRPVYSGTPPRVVVITSGKGGVGKTTTTANLGMCLARLNFKVVAIDADVGLRNLDLLLGLENRVNYTAMEVLNGECRLDQALIRDKRWTNFELLCINKPRYKMPLGFGGKALTWLVDALKKRPEGCPDFILIDCPAGIDAGFITAITPANEAVLVTTPDITSLRDADRVTGLLECDGIKDIKMVVNRVRSDMIKGEDMMSVLDVQEMLGLPLLGVIPEDSEVIKSTNRGYPLVLKKPPTLAGLALEQAAWRLVEQDSMKAVLIEEAPPKKSFLSFLGGRE